MFDGSAYNFYVNGAQDRVVTTPNNYWLDLQNISLPSPTNSICCRAFVDEFRLSSNVRYSSAFTPPVSAFTSDAYTISLNHFDTTSDSAYDLNLLDDLNNLPVQFTDTTAGGAFLHRERLRDPAVHKQGQVRRLLAAAPQRQLVLLHVQPRTPIEDPH